MDNAWTRAEAFFEQHIVNQDTDLQRALRNSAAAGLPPIQVGAAQGKLMGILARLARARTILEIGTLGGYSTMWLAKALPDDGELVTMEVDPRHAAVARQNLAQAGLSSRVRLMEGEALHLLPLLGAGSPERFDLVFIDADKPRSLDYLEWAIKLTRPGSVIVFDNVVRNAAILADVRDASSDGVRRMLDAIGEDARVTATVIQTVGAKGYDGFAIALRI